MARTNDTMTLSENNRLYLYRLLSQQLGCGKQTFMTKVEEALASDRMSAEDLGFPSTRELLEALDDFVTLTVFKGGRLYATIVAQPAWDEALALAEGPKASPAPGKPWKKKKGVKALKPIRPKRVKREKPTVAEPTPEPERAAGAADGADEGRRVAAATSTDADSAADATACALRKSPSPMADEPAVTAAEAPEADGESSSEPPAVDAPGASKTDSRPDGAAPSGNAPAPAFSLTVTYDPYRGFEGETKLESSPVVAPGHDPQPVETAAEAAPTAVQVEPARVNVDSSAGVGASAQPTPQAPARTGADNGKPAAHEPKAASRPTLAEAAATPRQPIVAPVSDPAPQPVEPPAPEPSCALGPIPSPEALKGYPTEFAAEVYCPAELIAELVGTLPFGTDALHALASDYERARTLELIRGTRAEAAFPLRIERADSLDPIVITIHKRSGAGMPWAITRIDA